MTNVYRAFVSMVDRIGEGDLVDILAGEHTGLRVVVQRAQGEWLYVAIYNRGVSY